MNGYPRVFEDEIAALRGVIQRDGRVLIGCEELLLLFPETAPPVSQFSQIAAIARAEHWSFTFLPNGSVEFAPWAQEPPPTPGFA